ncbi:MAG: GAF domain-containing protein [Trueperaceae bacterium]
MLPARLLVEQNRLLELIARGSSLDESLSSLCTTVPRLNPRVGAIVLLADSQRPRFSPRVAPDMLPSFGQGLKGAPISELAIGACGKALYSGEQVTCSDIANDPTWSREWRELCAAHGVRACHSAPVLGSDGKPVGSFMLCLDEPRELNGWERRLVDFGIHVAEIVIERDRVSQALRESEKRLRGALGIETVGVLFFDTGGRITDANDAFTHERLQPGGS